MNDSTSMKVFVVNPPEDLKEQPVHITKDMAGGFGFNADVGVVLPSLELIYHYLALRRDGFSASFYDLQAASEKRTDFFTQLKNSPEPACLVLITLPTWERDRLFLTEIRRCHPRAKIYLKFDLKNEKILREILGREKIEAILLGETELIVGKILRGETAEGAAYLKDGVVVFGKNLMVENLDDLPDLQLDFLDLSHYRYPLLPPKDGFFFTFQSSRGCPFACAYYCPYPLIQGRAWRAMSAEKIFHNLTLLVGKYNVRRILFRDATFTLNKPRIIELCQRIIKERLAFSWWCETRINCLDRELLSVMAEAGCRGINVGVETGDERLMKDWGKPGVDLASLFNIREGASAYGLRLHFLMLVGLPEETKKTLYHSLLLIRRLKPESLGVTTITPYPNTALYEDALKKGLVVDPDFTHYIGNRVVMRTKYLSPNEISHGRFLLQLAGFLTRQKSFFWKVVSELLKFYFWLWSHI